MGRRGRGGTWRRDRRGRQRGQRLGTGDDGVVPNNIIGRISVETSKYAIEYQRKKEMGSSGGKDLQHLTVENSSTDSTNSLSEDEVAIMEMMGFHGFGSTKGKAVESNHFGPAIGAARIEKRTKRQYRQYKNRKGGAQLLSSEASVKQNIQH